MAIEPKYERVGSSQRIKLGTTQAVIECKLPANDNSEITKILCTSAKSYIANTEVGEHELDFNGFVNFLVVYEGADNLTQSLDYSAEFKDKFKNNLINIGDQASLVATVVDVSTNSAGSNNAVSIVAVVEITADLITNNIINVSVGTEGANIFARNEEVVFNSLSQTINDNFEILQDIEIRDNVFQVLSVDIPFYIESVSTNSGYLTLCSGAMANVTYLTNEEVPQLKTHHTPINFTQEISADTVTQTSQLQNALNLRFSDIKVTTNLDSNSAVINLVLPFNYHGFVFNEQSVNAVIDIFSTENYLTTTTESIPTIVLYPSVNFSERVMGTIQVDENTPFIDEVLGNSCSSVVLASSYANEGVLVVEGIVYTTVLYLNKETSTNNSMEVEIPFSLELENASIVADAGANVQVTLGDVITRNKRGQELEVTANLFIYADLYGHRNEAVITNLEVTDEKPETDCVLVVYIAKFNDELWDIAKELNVSPDMILEQNPQLEFPLVGGEKIVIYRQREVLF